MDVLEKMRSSKNNRNHRKALFLLIIMKYKLSELQFLNLLFGEFRVSDDFIERLIFFEHF